MVREQLYSGDFSPDKPCILFSIAMLHLEDESQRCLPHVRRTSACADPDTPELATPVPNATTVNHQRTASRKLRIALACKRCKRRKQRCDGGHPSCQACLRVKESCTYERIARPQYPGGKTLYINALEERIALLESRLPDYAQDHFNTTSENFQQDHIETAETSDSSPHVRRASCRESLTGSISEELDGDDGNSLVDGVAYLSLCASGTTDTDHEPYYVGSSSGATIARVIQSSIYRGSGRRSSDLATANRRTQNPSTMKPSAHFADPVVSTSIDALPTPVQARALFDFFFERIHPRWPLLDRAVYEIMFQKQYSPDSLSVAERSIIHLIYAITARFLAVTKKPCGVNDEAQLTAATEHMEHILKQHDLATVQFLILLGVHGQRSPYGAGAWAQIRYATCVCIEMGLHRKRSQTGLPVQRRDAEIRRRAFWSCYCLDRVTSIVLGRAFAIADRDINVELPSTSPELWSLTHHDEYDPHKGQWSNVQPFIHIIKLDKIQSQIHKTVFRVDKDVIRSLPAERAKLDRKMAKIREDLDEWITTFPQTPKNDNKSTWMYDPESEYLDARDFYGVQYHKAVLFLFTIFLPILEISDERFITCARSAASVCNAYKRLSQNRTLTYTMISLHSCFVAGLTLIYCIWRDHRLFSYEVIEAAQNCSQILTIFGEKWPGAVKYRDIFDALSQSLFKLTMNQTNSASITGIPPSFQLNFETHTTTSLRAATEACPESAPLTSAQASRPTLSHLVTDAVKEAFMEVDEEAPGGWQGWRMWNEMVTEEGAFTSRQACGPDTISHDVSNTDWNPQSGSAVYVTDPVQEAAVQMGNFAAMHHDQWGLSGYR